MMMMMMIIGVIAYSPLDSQSLPIHKVLFSFVCLIC